jgi:hypothetical protein
MPAKSEIPLQKKTLNLYEGQYDKLAAMYPSTDPAKSIRDILQAHIEAFERLNPTPKVEVKI